MPVAATFGNLDHVTAVERAKEILQTGKADGVKKVEIRIETDGTFTIVVHI